MPCASTIAGSQPVPGRLQRKAAQQAKGKIQRMARVWKVSKKKINSAFLPAGCMSEISDFFFVYFLFDLMWQRTVGKGVTSLSWGVISVYSYVYPPPTFSNLRPPLSESSSSFVLLISQSKLLVRPMLGKETGLNKDVSRTSSLLISFI